MSKATKRKNSLNQETPGNDLEQKTIVTEDQNGVEPKENFYIDPKKKAAAKDPVNDLPFGDKVETIEELIFITGAKILKDKVVITFIERKPDNDSAELSYENKAKPHKDFIAAFDNLKVHLSVLCGYQKSTDVVSIAKVTKKSVEEFTATGFSIKGGEDKEGFSISGGNTGTYGWTGLNAPFVRNTNDPESGYVFIKELVKAIEKCQAEALKYRTGKHAPKAQQELFKAGEDE